MGAKQTSGSKALERTLRGKSYEKGRRKTQRVPRPWEGKGVMDSKVLRWSESVQHCHLCPAAAISTSVLLPSGKEGGCKHNAEVRMAWASSSMSSPIPLSSLSPGSD